MNHGELDHGLGLTRVDFIVTIESAVIGQPGEGAFDDPALGKDNELGGLVAFDDLNPSAEHGVRPGQQFSGVAAIDVDFLEGGNDAKETDQHGTRPGTILNPRRMNPDGEKGSHDIYRDVLLASLDFLAGIETARPPFEALLTERESMMATDGSALRPAFCRIILRKACRTTSQMPSRRQRRRDPYTVFQGGKSFGNGRHWPPVFRTYSIPLISARKSCFGGRPLPRTAGKGFSTYGFSTSHCSSLRSLGYIAFSS
jgi:hypothetical protein